MQQSVYFFDDFRLDVLARAIWRGGKLVELTPKEFDALLVLVENGGQAVSRETLIERLWGAPTNLEQSALPRHISGVRKKLGNARNGQPYVKALPGRGYYFAADVTTAPTSALPKTEVAAPRAPHARRKLFVWGGAAVIVGIAVTAIAMFHGASSHHGRPLVAVLWFHNRGRTEDAKWLSMALPEMLRTELSVKSAVRVLSGEDTARTEAELRVPEEDTLSGDTLRRIRRNVGADYVVAGFYTVLPGTQQVRIDVMLQDARRNAVIDSQSEHGPIGSLFNMVAKSGLTLRADLGVGGISQTDADALKDELPSNLESVQLFAEGLSDLRASKLIKARDLFEKAAASDPSSALIRSSLGEAWSRLGYERRARDESCAAFKMAPPVSRENQLLLEGRCRELSRDWPRTIDVYQSLWTFFPDELDHGLRLVHAEIAAGRAAEASRILAQVRMNHSVAGDPRVDLAEAEEAEAKGDFANELRAAKSAIEKGGKSGARLLVARAQLRACWALDYLGDRSRALDLAKTAQRTFAELGDKGGEALAWKNTADVLDDSGDHSGAIPIYKRALDRFTKIGSQTGIAVTLNNMGYALKDTGDLEGATSRFSESAQIALEIGDLQREAQALNSLAGVYWRRGALSVAKTTFDRAEAEFENGGDEDRAAAAAGNVGLVLKDEGKLLDARQKLEQSFDLSRKGHDPVGMARTSGNEGDLFVELGQLAEARHKYEDQLAIGNRIGDDKQRAYAFFGLGRVSLLNDDLSDARSQLKHSLDLRLRHDEQGLAAESRLGLAEVEIETGEAVGLTDARLAADQFRKEHERDQEAEATALVLRRSLEHMGEPPQNCETLFLRIKELLPVLQNHTARIATLIAIAQYEAAMGKLQQAIDAANEADTTAQDSADIELQLKTELLKADLESHPGTRARSLQATHDRASGKGFALIATEALTLKNRVYETPGKYPLAKPLTQIRTQHIAAR